MVDQVYRARAPKDSPLWPPLIRLFAAIQRRFYGNEGGASLFSLVCARRDKLLGP